MRLLLVGIAIILASTVVEAEEWRIYVNDAYAYTVGVPPGFVGNGEMTQGDGQSFGSADGTQSLLVLGGNSFDDIESLGARHMRYDAMEGWAVTIDGSTPGWVAYSGSRNGMVLKVRLIPVCPRWQYARLELSYPERDTARIIPLVERLFASFRPTGTADCR